MTKYFFFISGLTLSYIFVKLDREFIGIVTAILYGSMIIAEAIRTK